METILAEMPILMSINAVDKAYELLKHEGNDNLSLRISVSPGGCSGLRYALYFDDQNLDGDASKIFEGSGEARLPVKIDRMSAPYLLGAEVDFIDKIDKQGFVIENPNAHGSCSCGDSFN